MRRQRRRLSTSRRHKRWLPADKKVGMSARQRENFYFHDSKYAQKRADEGRELEARVRKILDFLKKRGEIIDFNAFAPWSPEDLNGFDFSTSVLVDNVLCRAMFGITSSFRCLKQYFKKHPGQNCVFLDPCAPDDEIADALINFVKRIAEPIEN